MLATAKYIGALIAQFGLIGAGLGINFSFLKFLNIIFFILFILLNLAFLYIEYLDIKCKNKADSPQYLKSGNQTEHIKKAVSLIIVCSGLYSNYITIKNEHTANQKLEQYQIELKKAKAVYNNLENAQLKTNFNQKIHMETILRGTENLNKLREQKTELMKKIEENKVNAKFTEGDSNYLALISRDETKLAALILEEKRAISDLTGSVKSSYKFAKEISKEPNESKILKMINEDIDIKKNSIFYFDEWWANFESLSGIPKLVCIMLLSNYLILWCILGIITGFYGNYLLERFNLEDRFPKLAFFIKYRKKISKYYILSNFLMIILICLMNLIFGISIIGVYL